MSKRPIRLWQVSVAVMLLLFFAGGLVCLIQGFISAIERQDRDFWERMAKEDCFTRLVATKNIAKGATVNAGSLRQVSATDCPIIDNGGPSAISQVLGKKTIRKINAGHPIEWKDIESWNIDSWNEHAQHY